MITVCVVLACLAALWLAAGFFFYNMTLPRRLGDAWRKGVSEGPKNETERLLVEWANAARPCAVSITSRDGLRLVGQTFTRDSGRWVIVVHGYTLGKEFMYYAAKVFYERGFSALTVDLRGHGESGGRSIGMGWLDRLDLVDWARWIERGNPGCSTILFGVSMGAATVLSASGEGLPNSVKAVVADCGYTCAADVFAYQAKKLYKLPSWLVMPPFALAARIMAGYGVYDASPLKQLKKGGKLPILLIHGEDDDFVPFAMLKPLAEAAGERAEVLTVRGAGHGESCVKAPELYWERVAAFTDKYLARP